MPSFESLIQTIAPAWGLKRARARALTTALETARGRSMRRFEGADRGRRTQGWASFGGSANAESRGSLAVLRERSRDLRRNNPWAGSAVRSLVSNIVGRGMRPKFLHKTKGEAERALDLWREWDSELHIDAEGRSNFGSMQASIVESMVEGGEVLVRRRRRRTTDGLSVPVQLQLLEADHIDTLRDGETDGRNRVIQGIRYNSIGRREGYWLFRDHPGDHHVSIDLTSRFVPADEIRHVYRLDRPGQVRGIPWSAPVILRIHDFDSYEDAEALRNVVAGSYSAFVRDLDPTASMSGIDAAGVLNGTENEKGQVIDELESGTIEWLPPGKTIEFSNPPQNETFPDYSKVTLRSIAKGFGVPYESLTGDLSGVNFSSARMGWLEFQRDVDRWRSHILVPHFCQPAFLWWRDAAEAAGLVQPGLTATWTPPRREMIDPRTETNMEIGSVRAGMKSLSEAVRSMGYDLEEVLPELQKDLELARSLGLVLSTDAEAEAEAQAAAMSVNRTEGSRSILEAIETLESRIEEGRMGG